MWHPNVDLQTGTVMLPILREDWRPVLNLNTVVFALQLLFLNPSLESQCNAVAAETFMNSPAEFEHQVRQSLHGGVFYGCVFPRNMDAVETPRSPSVKSIKRKTGSMDCLCDLDAMRLDEHDPAEGLPGKRMRSQHSQEEAFPGPHAPYAVHPHHTVPAQPMTATIYTPSMHPHGGGERGGGGMLDPLPLQHSVPMGVHQVHSHAHPQTHTYAHAADSTAAFHAVLGNHGGMDMGMGLELGLGPGADYMASSSGMSCDAGAEYYPTPMTAFNNTEPQPPPMTMTMPATGYVLPHGPAC